MAISGSRVMPLPQRHHARNAHGVSLVLGVIIHGLVSLNSGCGRFLRDFDRADRDPAMSAAKLREFEIMLRKLFVDGWILMDPSASKVPAAPQGAVFDTAVGMPLFWQERKSVSCLKALLAIVQAKNGLRFDAGLRRLRKSRDGDGFGVCVCHTQS